MDTLSWDSVPRSDELYLLDIRNEAESSNLVFAKGCISWGLSLHGCSAGLYVMVQIIAHRFLSFESRHFRSINSKQLPND